MATARRVCCPTHHAAPAGRHGGLHCLASASFSTQTFLSRPFRGCTSHDLQYIIIVAARFHLSSATHAARTTKFTAFDVPRPPFGLASDWFRPALPGCLTTFTWVNLRLCCRRFTTLKENDAVPSPTFRNLRLLPSSCLQGIHGRGWNAPLSTICFACACRSSCVCVYTRAVDLLPSDPNKSNVIAVRCGEPPPAVLQLKWRAWTVAPSVTGGLRRQAWGAGALISTEGSATRPSKPQRATEFFYCHHVVTAKCERRLESKVTAKPGERDFCRLATSNGISDSSCNPPKTFSIINKVQLASPDTKQSFFESHTQKLCGWSWHSARDSSASTADALLRLRPQLPSKHRIMQQAVAGSRLVQRGPAGGMGVGPRLPLRAAGARCAAPRGAAARPGRAVVQVQALTRENDMIREKAREFRRTVRGRGAIALAMGDFRRGRGGRMGAPRLGASYSTVAALVGAARRRPRMEPAPHANSQRQRQPSTTSINPQTTQSITPRCLPLTTGRATATRTATRATSGRWSSRGSSGGCSSR
jgi:hypothetical protein